MGEPGILDVLTKRGDVLRELCETTAYKRDLAGEMDHSRSTISRAINELEELDLVEYGESGYTATAAGRLAVQYLETFQEGFADLTAAEEVLEPLPADATVTPEVVAGSDALLAADPAPFRPLERIHRTLADADRYRAILPALDDSRHVRLLYEHVVTNERPAELVVTPELFDTLREEFPRQTAVMAEQGEFRVLVADDLPPFALTLADTGTSDDEFTSSTETTVSMVVFSESGGVHGVLTNETANAVTWAESRLATARRDATDRTDGLAPGSDDSHRSPGVSGGESSTIGQSLPVELEREGFVRLDPSYFRDEPVADPTTAWRAGLSLTEVHTGYAVERTVGDEASGQLLDTDDASAEGTTVPAALHEELAAGTDCLVVGPPGSGKSTVCKQVACAWYDDDRGPVLYREGGRGRPFESVDALIETVDAVEGHALVVVEDAVRPEANAAFECVDRLADREDVSVLLDARESEWRDPPEGVDPSLDLAVVTMPGLADLDVDRLVDHFEETVGEQVDIPRDRLREEVREEAESDDVAPSGVLLLLHRLTTVVDPLAEEQTNLEEAAAAVYDDLAGDDRALDVCVLANVLNAAGLEVTPDVLYAVGDADALAEVDGALDRLEWEVLFPRPDGRYRTVHETWSAAFLDHLLDAEGESAAAERFGDAVTALLGLADDADRRERITAHLGEQWELAAIADDPEGWAEKSAEAVYTMGRERPKLAPLFGDGSSAGDSIEVPAACAEAVGTRQPTWLGRLYSDGGYYDRAERAFDRLPTPDDVADSGGGENRERAVERLLGLARIAREQGSYDETERFAERCLDLLGDDGWPVARARAKLRLGQAASERGEFDTADSEYRDALAAFEEAGDRRRTAMTLKAVGGNARRQGEHDRAREYYERALAIHRDLGDRLGVARTLNALGVAARRQGEFDAAQGYFERSLGIARDLGDRKLRGDILNNIGIVASIRGEYDRAREYYERSLAVTRALGDSQGVDRTRTNLGLVLERLGEYDRAREVLEECLEHERDRDDRPGMASTHTNIGLVLTRQGRYDRAREHHEECIAISRELGLQHEETQGLGNLAIVERLQGQYDRAREHLEESLAIKRETGNQQGTMNSLFNLGQVALADGDYEEAQEYFERAGDVLEEGDPFRVAEGQVARAKLAVEQERLDDARELAAAARETFAGMGASHRVANSRRVLGRIEAAAGDDEAAREHWEAILETFESVGAPQDTLETLRLLLEDARERGDDDATREYRDRIEDCVADAPQATVDAHREWLTAHVESVARRADSQPEQEAE